ncbi:DUF917 family protein [Sinomonas sp. ASV322]|uniref:S-methyl thiohydantoin desulfurase domain-containing protein n=1 Tax=Sinomonas sp. ASV322 TaxID=3041920 RepID=UPI0027DBF6A5|nr:DUF917 family protein [Sinomonas sp. ASV322]MDQ4502308.1 DUF917 family protein [Sinomonas sp. ASV322]
MPTVLDRSQLPALARGFSLLGSGGGGTTTMLELMLGRAAAWPISVEDPQDLDPSTPCLGAAFVGSTMLLGERLPGDAPFAPLIAAVERWLGQRIPAVCSLEGGGLNGLVPLAFAGERVVVDADCTGRAVPGLDQMSLFVDRVPGVVVACDTGAGGVMLVSTPRAIDAERIIRSAIIQAGGTGGAVFAGFTVGDLLEHAILGNLRRALSLGQAYAASAQMPLHQLAAALGGRLLGHGRITAVEPDARDPHVKCIELAGARGEVQRIVARSETLAFLTDGRLEASAPAVIAVLDAVSREVLEVTDLTFARPVAAIELPAPPWWAAEPTRLRKVVPSAYGLDELDPPA